MWRIESAWFIPVCLSIVVHFLLVVPFIAGRDGPERAGSIAGTGAGMRTITVADSAAIGLAATPDLLANDLHEADGLDLQPARRSPIDSAAGPMAQLDALESTLARLRRDLAETGAVDTATPPRGDAARSATAAQGPGRGAALLPFDMLPIPSPPPPPPAKAAAPARTTARPPDVRADYVPPPPTPAPATQPSEPPPRKGWFERVFQPRPPRYPGPFDSVHADAPGATSPATAGAGAGGAAASSAGGVGSSDGAAAGAGGASAGTGAGAGAGASAGPGGASAGAGASAGSGGASAGAGASAGPGGASASTGGAAR